MTSLGERLRRAREEKGWSTRQLERETARLGRKVSHGYISQIENERYKANPSLATLEVLARALGKPITYLLGGAEGSRPYESHLSEGPSQIVRRIEGLAVRRRLTIEGLARMVGAQDTEILSLSDNNPDLALVQRLAMALGTTMHYLLGRIDDPAPLPGIAVAHHDPEKGVEPGEPLPPETQLIVERAIIAAKKEWGWD